MDFKVNVFLLACGKGLRTALSVPKQFCPVFDRPLISYCLELFEGISWVDRVYVVVAPQWGDFVSNLVHKPSKVCVFTTRPVTRHVSVLNCIRRMEKDLTAAEEDNLVVVVHDAARPFIDENIVRNVAIAAREHGAAGAVGDPRSAFVESDSEGKMTRSIGRQQYLASHTPQAFTFRVLQKAYQKISEHDLLHGSEGMQPALDYAGCRPKLVEASGNVWKVTHRQDFYTAEGLAKERNSIVTVVGSQRLRAVAMLRAELLRRRLQVGVDCEEILDVPSETNCVVLCTEDGTVDDLSQQCQQALDTLVASESTRHGGTLAYLYPVQCVEDKLSIFSRLAKQLAAAGEARGVCVYSIVMEDQITQPGNDERLHKACVMTASLVYHRDHMLTGQVFVA